MRRRAIAIAAVATVAIVIVVTMLLRLDGDADLSHPTPSTTAFASPPALPDAGGSPANVDVARGPLPAPGAEKIEVCGIGWVDVNADGTVDEDAVQSAPTMVEARRRLLGAMAAAPDEYARAVATWLDLVGNPSEPVLMADLGQTICEAANCAALEEWRRRLAAWRNDLAARAAVSSDPRLYELAFRACGATADPGPCAMLNAARWAQLDAGNAAPWLFLLEKATSRHDEAAVDDALFHIATAERFQDRSFAVASAVYSHASPRDIDRAAAVRLGFETLGLSARQMLPLKALGPPCRVDAFADVNRRQMCDGVAEALVERSGSLIAHRIGVGIGRRLGWPEQRTDATTGMFMAWTEAEAPTTDDSLVTCSGVTKVLARLARRATVSEVARMQQWAAASGRSRESFAAAGRAARLARADAESPTPAR